MLNGRVAKNAVDLYVLQAANYVLPFISLPYLARVLGPDGYGTVIFALSLATYFSIVVDFGFSYAGTRRVAELQSDPQQLGIAFLCVMLARVGLLVASFVVFFLLISFVDMWRGEWKVFATSFFLVIGTALVPTWFFQGIEKMRPLVVANMLIRAGSIIGIFTFVHHQQDEPLVVFLLASVPCWVFIVLIPKILQLAPLRFWKFEARTFVLIVRESFYAFVSTTAASLYLNTVPFMLGLSSSREAVGLYGVASKLVLAIVGLCSPIAQSVYPRLVALTSAGEHGLAGRLRCRAGIAVFAIAAIGSLVLLVGSSSLTEIVFGHQFAGAAPVVRVLACVPLLIVGSNYYGVLVLFTNGRFKGVAVWQAIVGAISILWLYFFIQRFEERGAAWSVLISEALITLGFFIMASKEKLSARTQTYAKN